MGYINKGLKEYSDINHQMKINGGPNAFKTKIYNEGIQHQKDINFLKISIGLTCLNVSLQVANAIMQNKIYKNRLIRKKKYEKI